MQFTIIALLSIVSVALAGPIRLDDIVARAPLPEVATETAAMSNANGDVVDFNAASVYQPVTNPN